MLLSVFIVSLSQAGARLSAGAILRLTNPCYHSFLTTALASFMEFEKKSAWLHEYFQLLVFQAANPERETVLTQRPKGPLVA